MAKTSESSGSAKQGGFKRWLKIGAAVAALLGVAAAAAPFFVPWNKLKDQATAFVSQKLGRKLSIEKVEVSLFTGVKLVNIELANGRGFSKEPLFKNASAKLNFGLFNLFSLLTGKVVINAIEFKSPSILVEKDAEGRFNFAGMGAKGAGAESAPEGEKAAAPKSLPVVIAAFVIDDGNLVYRDRAKRGETAIKGLDFKLLGFSLKSGGDQRLELKFTAETEGKKIPVSLVSNFKLDLGGESLELKSLDLNVPSVKLSASGAVKGFKSPDLDLKASAAVALGSLAKDLLPPSALKSVPGGLALDGGVTLDLNAKGAASSLEKMALNGSLSFDKVGAKYGDYPALKNLLGTLSFDKAGADLPSLSMDLGGSPVNFAFSAKWGSLDNLLGGARNLKANVTYKLTSPKLVLDPVMPILMAEDTPQELEQKAAVAKKTGGIQDLSSTVPAGLSLKGNIQVDSVVYKKINTGKLAQQISLAKQKLESATNLDLYGGTFWERTKADLGKSGPPFSLQSGLSGIKFDGLVDDAAASFPDSKAVQDLKGKVFGMAGYKLDATGKGFKNPARMKNLKASGSFFMKDGKILKTEWQEKTASVIPHPQTQDALRKDLVFQNLRGDFSLSAEQMTLKSFALGSGEDWRAGEIFLQASGVYGPQGRLDFKVVPHFSPTSVQLGGELANAFNDSKGWATYDYIAYYGPNSKDAKADFAAGLSKAAQNALKKKMDDAKQKAADEAKKKLQEQGGELLKKLPGNLFGQ